jgi:hypothetical protein
MIYISHPGNMFSLTEKVGDLNENPHVLNLLQDDCKYEYK